MSHPNAPHPNAPLVHGDGTRGFPESADRIRAQRQRLAAVALEAAFAHDASLRDRYPELALRQVLLDLDRHLLQLAKAVETDRPHILTTYVEWLVPVYRRRGIPALDFVTVLEGVRDAVRSILAPEESAVTDALIDTAQTRLRHHAPLPGDHKGNKVVRFFWKGTGILDKSVV